MRAHYLETTLDSAVWPVDYPAAGTIKLSVPVQSASPVHYQQSAVAPAYVAQPPAGTFATEAELRANELQDLADALGELGTAAAGLDFKYRVHIELSGNPSKDVISQVNKILQKIKSSLNF